MTYAYPRVPDVGMRLKTLLSTYRSAGGKDACVLFHRVRAEGRNSRARSTAAGTACRRA